MQTPNKHILPSLEQVIQSHLQDIDYMNLNLQNLGTEDALTKSTTLPIHSKNFIIASRATNTNHRTSRTPQFRSKQLTKSQSLIKPINVIDIRDPSSANNSRKIEQPEGKSNSR